MSSLSGPMVKIALKITLLLENDQMATREEVGGGMNEIGEWY